MSEAVVDFSLHFFDKEFPGLVEFGSTIELALGEIEVDVCERESSLPRAQCARDE